MQISIKKGQFGLWAAGIMTAVVSCSVALADDAKPQGTDAPKAQDKGECHGINSCKGKGECGGPGYSCAGNNSCKGKGWVTMTAAECKKKGGKFKAET